MLSIFSNSDKLLIPPNSIEGKEGMLLLLLIATRLGILTKKPFTVRVRKIELAENKILSMLQVHPKFEEFKVPGTETTFFSDTRRWDTVKAEKVLDFEEGSPLKKTS